MEAVKIENKVFDKVFKIRELSSMHEIVYDIDAYSDLIKAIVQKHKVFGELEDLAFQTAIYLTAYQLGRGDNYGIPEFDISDNLENLSMDETLSLYHYLFKKNKCAPKPYARGYNDEYYYYNVDLPHEIILASTLENIIDKTIYVIANHQLEILKIILRANIMHPLWYTIAGANTSEDVEEEKNRINCILS